MKQRKDFSLSHFIQKNSKKLCNAMIIIKIFLILIATNFTTTFSPSTSSLTKFCVFLARSVEHLMRPDIFPFYKKYFSSRTKIFAPAKVQGKVHLGEIFPYDILQIVTLIRPSIEISKFTFYLNFYPLNSEIFSFYLVFFNLVYKLDVKHLLLT